MAFRLMWARVAAQSRAVTLFSNNPPQAPEFFNYMSEAEDCVFRAAIRAARDIFSQPALTAVAGEGPGATEQRSQLDELSQPR